MRWSAHISWLFTELPYAERAGAARRAGFTTIETAWPESREARETLITAVAHEHVEVALLNCSAGDVGAGERGFVNDDSRREEAEREFAEAVELAGAIGAPSLNLLVGRALPGMPQARQRASIVAALREFTPIAAAAGVSILLEPLNSIDNPGFLAATPDAAVELIEAAGDDRVGLLLDSFHLARAGEDPVVAITRHAERIAHVQLSDYPGRRSPGTGTLDFVAIFGALVASGYNGAVGLEYEPNGATDDGLAAVVSLGGQQITGLYPHA